MTATSPAHLGRLVRDARLQRGLTQQQLADSLHTSQSTITRIEMGGQNLTLEMINKIAQALESPLIEPVSNGVQNLRIEGGAKLSGTIEVRSSKNAAVALLCASLLNRGTTRLRGIARIEEVNRIIEVLDSLGVSVSWSADKTDLTLTRPASLDINNIDHTAAKRTRSYFMILPTLMKEFTAFDLPYAGGCDLGTRTIEPHLQALRHYGLSLTAHDGLYQCTMDADRAGDVHITLTERGDMATENAILAAALHEGQTVIRNASSNYQVQDLCFFLQDLGVGFDGIGTTTLRIRGRDSFESDIVYAPSEDPIEAMSLITAAIVTGSELEITRCPIEFLEIELATLAAMGLRYARSNEYTSHNNRTRLVDLTIYPSDLTAPRDKIHPMPFPGLNIDNLPFFAVIAATANGDTLIHDWVYENRAIHLLDLGKLGADVQLLDPHRLSISGPARWRGRDLMCPPALRPAVCILLATLAAQGESVLRDIYVINRGYEDLPQRLNSLGASIEVFKG